MQPSMPPSDPRFNQPMPGQSMAPMIQPDRSPVAQILKALVLSVLLVIAGAAAWGLLAFYTERIFALLAIAIGYGVANVLAIPFRRPLAGSTKVILGVMTLVVTLLAVVLGTLFFLALDLNASTSIGLGLAVIETLKDAGDLLRIVGGDMGLALLFGVLGPVSGASNTFTRHG